MKKQYWFVYEVSQATQNGSRDAWKVEAVSETNPISFIIDCNKKYNSYMQGNIKVFEKYTLLNWKEITEEEYNLYKYEF